MSESEEKPDVSNQEEKVEEVVEQPTPTYRDHIRDLLGKVSVGEKVFDAPSPDTVGEALKAKGVQGAIRNVFHELSDDELINESVEDEVESLDNAKETPNHPKEVSPSSFEKVMSKDQAPDIFPFWQRAKNLLRRIGQEADDGLTKISRKVMGRDDEPALIQVQLVKHKDYDAKPYMMVSFDEEDDSTPAELAIPYIENVGISVLKDTIYESPKGNLVYFEFDV